MKMRRAVESLLTEAQEADFRKWAEARGLTLEEFLRRVVDAEHERLTHAERSKPKHDLSKSLGTQTQAQMVAELDSIYQRLEAEYRSADAEEEFKEFFSPQKETYKSLAEKGDLEGLEDFLRKQPWILRRW